jgi:hypothetical protein
MVNLRTLTDGTVTPDANYSTPGSPLFQRGPRLLSGPLRVRPAARCQQRLAAQALGDVVGLADGGFGGCVIAETSEVFGVVEQPWARRQAVLSSHSSLIAEAAAVGSLSPAARGQVLARPLRGRRPPRQDPGRKRILGQSGYRKIDGFLTARRS